MENKKIGIVGFGEVGKAIASFYENPLIEDTGTGERIGDVQLDVLHICIPHFRHHEFLVACEFAINKWAMGGLVFIHSTVPVGTIANVISKSHALVVHAPIRGIHPKLADGIKTFPMYVGAESAGAGRLAAEHLTELGIKPVVFHKAATTELLKLLDTTYYGLAIAYHAYAQKLCDAEGVNFGNVMTLANTSYNDGYVQLGKRNVVRPVLHAPEGGRIGGHCVVPNAEMLREQFGDDPILEAILRHK